MVFAEYFINHMVNIMHHPFFIMDENENIHPNVWGRDGDYKIIYRPSRTHKKKFWLSKAAACRECLQKI